MTSSATTPASPAEAALSALRRGAAEPFLARLLTPPAPLVVLHVASLVVPLALLLVGLSAWQVRSLSNGFEIAPLAAVLGRDLLFTTVYGLAFTWLLHLSRGLGRRFATLALHLLTFLLMVVAVVEHGTFLATGTVLDWYMVEYAWENFAMLREVLASEVPKGVALVFAALAGVALAPIGFRRAAWVRAVAGRTRHRGDWRRPRVYGSYAAALVLLGASAGTARMRVEGPVALLQPNAFVELVDGALASVSADLAGDEEVNLADVEIPDPVRITPTVRHEPRNVVVVVVESARSRSTTPYAPHLETTPFLAELAKKGALVEDAFAVVTHTSKSLVAIQCGIYPKIVTPIVEALPDAIPGVCLARLLRDQGYATAFFQPAKERFESRYGLVQNFGFEHFAGRESLPQKGFDESSYFGFEDDIMLEPALAWIDRVEEGERPFFLTLLTLTSHHDYGVPDGFERRRFAPEDDELDAYLNTLAYTDRFLRKFVTGLDERGLLDETLLVVVGDHGEGFGEHGRKQHDNVIYEEGQHVPLLLVGPGIGPGTRIRGLRQVTDVMPTVLDLLGYHVQGGDLAGRSLLEPEGHDQLFHSCWYKEYCMAWRQGSWKVLDHYRRREPEVFDLSRDPLEQEDLAGEDGLPFDTDAVLRRLRDWRDRTNALYAAHEKRRRDHFVRNVRPEPQVPMDVMLGDAVRLLGYSIDRKTAKLGEPIHVSWYFEVVEKPGPGWGLFVHVLGPKGRFINADHDPVSGAYKVEDWEPGQFVEDRHMIRLDRNAKPGEYRLLVGLWNRNDTRGEVEARAEPRGDGIAVDKRRLHVTSLRFEP